MEAGNRLGPYEIVSRIGAGGWARFHGVSRFRAAATPLIRPLAALGATFSRWEKVCVRAVSGDSKANVASLALGLAITICGIIAERLYV